MASFSVAIGTMSFRKGFMAIMVPSEAPIGMDRRIAFTIMPMKNDMATERKGDGRDGETGVLLVGEKETENTRPSERAKRETDNM